MGGNETIGGCAGACCCHLTDAKALSINRQAWARSRPTAEITALRNPYRQAWQQCAGRVRPRRHRCLWHPCAGRTSACRWGSFRHAGCAGDRPIRRCRKADRCRGSDYSAGRNNWRLVAKIRATDIKFATPRFDTSRLPRLLTRSCLASPLTGPPHWSTLPLSACLLATRSDR